VVDRRSFIGAFAGGLLAAPLVARAQPQLNTYRIGILAGSSPTSPEAAHVWRGFFQGLRELGYVEGRNLVVEGRYYGDSIDRLRNFAEELVRLKVDVIVVGASPAPEAAKNATSTIPIVLTNHNDPVGSGLVTSLARPQGNITGVSLATPVLRGKQLQLLQDLVPGLSSVAVLASPSVPSHALDVRELQIAARSLTMRLQVVEARAPDEIAEAFSEARQKRAGALIVLGSSMFFANRAQIVELATNNKLPAMYGVREFAELGGLVAYAPNLRDSFRRAAAYVDRILKGARPGDLPIEQPTTFELVINLKTAKALGLAISQSLLLRADEVIR
jgi:putative ABC transport system substrate-binding protein